ncbi:WD domain protein [Diaporthe australafricana]|uniref:Mitochondrial division protein 1 n=1 Tax=Diaporthe australafricana TaxID=127596 RepID=A0ABR3X825_9PEZI
MSDPEFEDRTPNQSSKRRKRNDGSAEHSSPEPEPKPEPASESERPRDPSPTTQQQHSQRGSLSIRHGRPKSRSPRRRTSAIQPALTVKVKVPFTLQIEARLALRLQVAVKIKVEVEVKITVTVALAHRCPLEIQVEVTLTLTLTLAHLVAPHPPPPDRPSRKPLRPNFEPSLELRGHEKPISQVRISPDGRWIASASADGTAMVWDAATGAHMDTFVGHMAGVSCLAWSPDSETLATGSDDKAIRLWNRTTGDPAHAGGADENTAASIGRIGTSARGIGGRAGDAGVRGSGGRKPLLGHHNYLYCLAFSPKGNILASGSYDEAVFLWDVRAGRLMRSLPAHSDPVSGIDFCLDGTLVASCSTDGLIRIWDTATGQCLRTLVHEDNPSASSVCFSPNGRFVLASYTDSCVRLWDFINMPCAVKKTYQGHVNEGYSVGGCFGVVRRRLPRSGRKPVANGDIGQDGEEEAALNGEEPAGDGVEGVGGEDESVPFVASASEDGDVVMWGVRTKEVVQRIQHAHAGVCFWVDVHSASGTMVTCGDDRRIVVHRHRDPDPDPEELVVEEEDDGGRANGGVNGDYPPADENGSADLEMRGAELAAAVPQVNGNGHLGVAAAVADGDVGMGE